MLVGSAPFESESREEVCSGILDREPVYAGWTSRGAKNFIKAALSKVGTNWDAVIRSPTLSKACTQG